MRKKLLIAAEIGPELINRAREDGRFDIRIEPVRTEEELAAIVGEAEVLVTRAYNRVSRRVIERAGRLEMIAQATSGIDNIDAGAALERGIAIVNLRGENANAVAELVVGIILSLTRTIPFYTREVAAGRWPREDCATRHEMAHFRLGIVGLGEVGRRVSRLAAAFSMSVAAYDPYITDDDFRERGAARAGSLGDILVESDIVSLHVPLTAETRGMIGADEVARMRRGAILINAARGEVLDQRAALEALKSNHLAGLSLDVFPVEPPNTTFPDDPRLILTPHIAGCTHECHAVRGEKLFEKIVQFYV